VHCSSTHPASTLIREMSAAETALSQPEVAPVTTESTPLKDVTVDNGAVTQRDVVISTSIPAKTWRDLDALNGDYDNLGPTTTVCPPINGESPFYERSFLIPHEALRFDLLLLERAVQPQYFQATRQWKVKRISHWYHTFFLPLLHHHHDIEEKIIFPRYKQKPGAVVPESLETDHASMLKKLNDISALLKKMESTMDEKPLESMAEELRTRISEIAEETRTHFAFEEEHLSQVIKEHITQDEEKAIVNAVVASFSFAQLSTHLPSVVAGQRRCGGVKMQQSFLAELPPPPRILYAKFWKSQFDVECVQYISDVCIDSASEPPIKRPSCCGCIRYY